MNESDQNWHDRMQNEREEDRRKWPDREAMIRDAMNNTLTYKHDTRLFPFAWLRRLFRKIR